MIRLPCSLALDMLFLYASVPCKVAIVGKAIMLTHTQVAYVRLPSTLQSATSCSPTLDVWHRLLSVLTLLALSSTRRVSLPRFTWVRLHPWGELNGTHIEGQEQTDRSCRLDYELFFATTFLPKRAWDWQARDNVEGYSTGIDGILPPSTARI